MFLLKCYKSGSTEIKNICNQHLSALTIESKKAASFVSSISTPKNKRWIAPVAIIGATIASTLGAVGYAVAKDAEREKQIKSLEAHSTKLGKLLLNLTTSEFSAVNSELERVIAIQLEQQLKIMIIDFATKIQEYLDEIQVRYAIPTDNVPLDAFLAIWTDRKKKFSQVELPVVDDLNTLLTVLPPARIIVDDMLVFAINERNGCVVWHH